MAIIKMKKKDSPLGPITFLAITFFVLDCITRCEFPNIVVYRSDLKSNQNLLVVLKMVEPLCNNKHVLHGILVL